jgi:predicted RNase H-like HicB family nuclease
MGDAAVGMAGVYGDLIRRPRHATPECTVRCNLVGCVLMNEFTAVVERDGPWFVAYCLEIPGANGQGVTKDEALQSLREAISLILHDRREDARRRVPASAEQETVIVE